MRCASSSSFWRPSLWAWGLASLLLWSCLILPATADSTTAGPPPHDGRPLSERDFDSALVMLRARLMTSLSDSLELRQEAEALRMGLEDWRTKALTWSSELTDLRKDSEDLSNSLTDSLRREASTREAAEKRARLDAEALTQARAERDLWRVGAVAGGVLAAVALVWGATR